MPHEPTHKPAQANGPTGRRPWVRLWRGRGWAGLDKRQSFDIKPRAQGSRQQGGFVMTFEQLVQSARARQGAGFDPVPVIVEALVVLAGERMTPAFEGPIETLRQPRSYSHWGIH